MLKVLGAACGVVMILAAPALAVADLPAPVDVREPVTASSPASGLGLSKQAVSRVAPSRNSIPSLDVLPAGPAGPSKGEGFAFGSLWIAIVGIVLRPTGVRQRRGGGVRRTFERYSSSKLRAGATKAGGHPRVMGPNSAADTILRRYDTRLPFPPRTLVVTVGGYGSTPGNTFGALLAAMGVGESQVKNFDWNWDGRFGSSSEASRRANIDQGLLTFRSWLDTLEPDTEISLVGHSKGAVLIAEFLASQDRVCGYDDRIRSAVLLDPPLAAGVLGQAQSIGDGLFGLVPNDGGFKRKWNDGSDKLNDLGRAGGVAVRIIRNPDAAVTNLGPTAGIVMYDLADDGAGSPLDAARAQRNRWYSVVNPVADLARSVAAIVGRVEEAHREITDDPRVAVAIRQEIIAPGSSVWRAGPVYSLTAEPIAADQRRWGNCPAPSQ
jgi:hypothetical protein